MKKFAQARHLDFLKISKIRQIMNSAPSDSINLGLGEIQFPLAEYFLSSIEELLKTENTYYTPNAGLPELKQKICNYYKITFNDNVCVTAGAEEALFATLNAVLNSDDEVLIADPGFVAYGTIVKMMKAIPVYFDLNVNDFSFIEQKFSDKISAKTKVVLLNNPINPTGTTYTKENLEFIVDICEKHNILLVVDEVYRELNLEEKIPTILDISKNAVVISSLSKSHALSGWRLGWVASHRSDIIKSIVKIHQYICTCAHTLSQRLAVRAFSHKGKEVNEYLKKLLLQNRQFVQKKINHNKLLPNNHHPYFFVKVQNDIEVTKKLLQRHVIVIPGSAFGKNGKNWIRINYGIDLKLLGEGIDILLDEI